MNHGLLNIRLKVSPLVARAGEWRISLRANGEGCLNLIGTDGTSTRIDGEEMDHPKIFGLAFCAHCFLDVELNAALLAVIAEARYMAKLNPRSARPFSKMVWIDKPRRMVTMRPPATPEQIAALNWGVLTPSLGKAGCATEVPAR